MPSRRYKALLVDFYGTLVREDGAIINRIADAIAARSALTRDRGAILRGWDFTERCAAAFGAGFQTQRTIEQESLAALLTRHRVDLDAAALSAELFAYWRAPEAQPSTAAFLATVDVPMCVVSNIDADDLDAAIAHHGWRFEHIVTSEGCRAYKPRPEPFRAALERLGLGPADVLHVGDSLGSDVAGAGAVGIAAAWLNPHRRPLPTDAPHTPAHVIDDLAEVSALLS